MSVTWALPCGSLPSSSIFLLLSGLVRVVCEFGSLIPLDDEASLCGSLFWLPEARSHCGEPVVQIEQVVQHAQFGSWLKYIKDQVEEIEARRRRRRRRRRRHRRRRRQSWHAPMINPDLATIS